MQFKTKSGLVDIPNAEVLAAADVIRDQPVCAKLRSALVRTTGSLGLIIKGAGAGAPGHKENYDHACKVLVETDLTTLKLKGQAVAAIDTLNADDSVTREEMRDILADVSNHIDDLMRAIDAASDRAGRSTGD